LLRRRSGDAGGAARSHFYHPGLVGQGAGGGRQVGQALRAGQMNSAQRDSGGGRAQEEVCR
jgi:hypothetical protein